MQRPKSVTNLRMDLPVARNPLAYCKEGTKIPSIPPVPPNFSESGVRRAELRVNRPQSAVRSLAVPEKYPLRLEGVAPADKVPVREIGTRPGSALRAFVSTRSNGVILYQAALPDAMTKSRY